MEYIYHLIHDNIHEFVSILDMCKTLHHITMTEKVIRSYIYNIHTFVVHKISSLKFFYKCNNLTCLYFNYPFRRDALSKFNLCDKLKHLQFLSVAIYLSHNYINSTFFTLTQLKSLSLIDFVSETIWYKSINNITNLILLENLRLKCDINISEKRIIDWSHYLTRLTNFMFCEKNSSNIKLNTVLKRVIGVLSYKMESYFSRYSNLENVRVNLLNYFPSDKSLEINITNPKLTELYLYSNRFLTNLLVSNDCFERISHLTLENVGFVNNHMRASNLISLHILRSEPFDFQCVIQKFITSTHLTNIILNDCHFDNISQILKYHEDLKEIMIVGEIQNGKKLKCVKHLEHLILVNNKFFVNFRDFEKLKRITLANTDSEMNSRRLRHKKDVEIIYSESELCIEKYKHRLQEF